MHSSMYGKIEKAIRYEKEPDRIHFQTVAVDFRGDNDTYKVELKGGHWACNCHTFGSLGTCSHVMALQRILDPMLDEDSRSRYEELRKAEETVLN